MAQKINLHINSDIDRRPEDLSTSCWTTYLANPILINTNDVNATLSVDSIEIPNAFYNFGIVDSIFWWVDVATNTLNGEQIPTDRNFTDGTQFASYMSTALLADNIAFSYDVNTNRLTITNNRATAIKIIESYRFSLYSGVYNSAIDKLGFTDPIPNNILAGGTLTAPSVLKLLRTNCFYLTADIVDSPISQSVVPSPYRTGSEKIICRVSAGNWGSLSQLNYLTGSNVKIKSENIKRIEFNLLDDNFYRMTELYLPITLSLKLEIS
jgi:hypothetical protein